MRARLFDHLDLRVRDLKEADAFYQLILPPLGFPTRGVTPLGICFEAAGSHPKPEFIGLIEDKTHTPNASRIAFWCDTREDVDAFAAVLARSGAGNVEGPMFCPEYSPTYYAIFFNDPSGNRLEVCCRTAK